MSYTDVLKHLQGQHDQHTHARGGGGGASDHPMRSKMLRHVGTQVTIRREGSPNRIGTLMFKGQSEFKLTGGFTTYKFDDVKSVYDDGTINVK